MPDVPIHRVGPQWGREGVLYVPDTEQQKDPRQGNRLNA